MARLADVLVIGGLGAAGYYGYRYWQRQQMAAAATAAAEEARASGMSLKDGITTAAATACKMVGSVYGVPPSASAGLCGGLAKIAYATTEATVKGAVIVGKVVGKGAAAAGKGIGKGAKFAAYTAPKKVIGTAVTKSIDATLGKVLPKSASKVAKKVLCLGIFCGLEGLDYPAAVDAVLADVAPSPLARARRLPSPSGPNPFRALGRPPAHVIGGSVARGVRRAARLAARLAA
jgi:hypothetical protein